jgi:hemolysin-activating ACP:hemolysin acyltransferase
VLKISENERESKKKLINHKPKTNENQEEKIRKEESLLTFVIDCVVAPFCNGKNEERDVKVNLFSPKQMSSSFETQFSTL